MSSVQQMGFDFLADLPTTQSLPKKRIGKKAQTKNSPLSQLEQIVSALPLITQATAEATITNGHTPAQKSLEAMIKSLEETGNYRVLRRLIPTLAFPPTQQNQNICRVIILDTETTGLDVNKDKIIELAMLYVTIDMDTGLPCGNVEVLDEFQDPGFSLPPEIQQLTSITDAMVAGKTLDIERIRALIAQSDLIIAHNAKFDRSFMESQFPEFKNIAWACSFSEVKWKALGHASARLVSLANDFGFFYDAHRADMDCHALLKILSTPIEQQKTTGLSTLIEQSYRQSYKLQATAAPFEAKDSLKARGYRWNAESKVWCLDLDNSNALQQEREWLKENVYNQKNQVIQVEKLDGKTRFSTREGALIHQRL